MEELVNIPALLCFSDGGTRFQSLSGLMVCPLMVSRNGFGKSGPIISRDSQETKSQDGVNLSGGIAKKNF
jgi:hypothetical protein